MDKSLDIKLLRLLAALPPLVLATSFSSALVLIGIYLIILLPLTVARLVMPTHLSQALRDTLSLLVAAAAGGIADVLLAAYAPTFSTALQPYLPFTIFCIYGLTNSHAEPLKNWRDALRPLSQVILALLATGLVRELVGTGTAFDQLGSLFGGAAENWSLRFTDYHRGVLLALMPCTVLIVIGLLLAARNYCRKPEATPPPDTKIRRVRVTGPVS